MSMTEGEYRKVTRIKANATPIDNRTKFAWYDDDYEEVEEWHQYTKEELDSMAAAELRVTLEDLTVAVEELAEMISTMMEG